MAPEDLNLDIGIKIHVRSWKPAGPGQLCKSFLLVHGLSSNARTWDQAAPLLARAGYHVTAIDQRGHGLSEKPSRGYDFNAITTDLHQIIEKLDLKDPILVGQSWGGNVLLEYAARFPGTCRGLVFVDGGYLNLRERGPWERTADELRPPELTGVPLSLIAERIRQAHPDWSEEGIQSTLGNFEILEDQTIRPWLSLEHHMQILRAMYDQDPTALYPRVQEPVLICAADDGGDRMALKRQQVQAAAKGLHQAVVRWFSNSAHDIHVDQPVRLTAAILEFAGTI